jgi:hypothetical protein
MDTCYILKDFYLKVNPLYFRYLVMHCLIYQNTQLYKFNESLLWSGLINEIDLSFSLGYDEFNMF